MNVGIYKITHRDSGRIYIGQSKNLRRREIAYRSSGGGGNTTSVIKRAITKYGWDAFDYEHLLYCAEDMLNEYEVRAISSYDCLAPKGFNLETGGGDYTVHELTKQRISKANKGRIPSDDTRRKMSEAQKQRWATSEATDKQKATGRRHGKYIRSIETKAKISASLVERGKTNPESFANFKGKRHSTETKEKMKQAHLKRWAAIRAAKEQS